MAKHKQRRLVRPSHGPSPKLLGKGAAHRDRTKYTRKQKHEGQDH